jgi:PQQ enzyme repeat.
MKQTIVLLASILSSLFFSACNKKMSTDLPLDKEPVASVYITTENGNLLSYDVNTGNKRWELATDGPHDGVVSFYT